METRTSVRDGVRQLLAVAIQSKAELDGEQKALTDLIAGLELALGEVVEPTNGAAAPKRRHRAVQTKTKTSKPVARVVRKRNRPVIAKRGEIHKSVLEAFGHHDGKAIPTVGFGKYMMRHVPPSLRRKGLDLRAMTERAYQELWRMKRQGLVVSEGKGKDLVWSIAT